MSVTNIHGWIPTLPVNERFCVVDKVILVSGFLSIRVVINMYSIHKFQQHWRQAALTSFAWLPCKFIHCNA